MQGGWRKATPLLTVQDLETSLSSSTTLRATACARADRPKAQPQALMISPKLGSPGQRQAPFPEHPGFWTPQAQLTELLLAQSTYFGTREAGAPFASGVFIANCPLSLLPQRLRERGHESVVARRAPSAGRGPFSRQAQHRKAQTLLFSCHPILRTEFSPIRILLQVLSTPAPLLTASHPNCLLPSTGTCTSCLLVKSIL